MCTFWTSFSKYLSCLSFCKALFEDGESYFQGAVNQPCWLTGFRQLAHFAPKVMTLAEPPRSRALDGKREGGRQKQPQKNNDGYGLDLCLESKILFCRTCVFFAFYSSSLPFHWILLSMATWKSLYWPFSSLKKLNRNLDVLNDDSLWIK